MTMSDKAAALAGICADLKAEGDTLLETLRGLDDDDWGRDTPAEGWTVRDQVTHLAFFDDATVLALRDRAGFLALREELLALGPRFPDVVAERAGSMAPDQCLDWLRRSRAELLEAYDDADPSARLPWYGPDMGVLSSATGRLMETWAHGQDVRDSFGIPPVPTPRLRHIADIGVRTYAFSFQLHGRDVPTAPVRVELAGPDGSAWAWGPEGADDVVAGPALDFCLVVTQRRNVLDTGLTVTGGAAQAWMQVAQAFAGRPTDPRPAGHLATQGVAR